MGGRGTLQQTEGEGAVDKSACASSSQALLASAQPLCGFRKEPPERSARSRGTTSASEPASVHFQLEPTASLSERLADLHNRWTMRVQSRTPAFEIRTPFPPARPDSAH